MKHVVPFYPVVCQTPREDFFRIGKDCAGGEIVSVKNYNKFQILKKISGQNVHAHGRGFPFPEACSLFSKKAVYSPHNDTVGSRWWTRFIRRKAFNRYSKIICQTEYGKEHLVGDGINKNKIVVIPNPADYKFFSKPKGGTKFRKKFGLKKDEKFALSIGIRNLKNPDVIAEACRIAGIRVAMVGPVTKNEVSKTWQGGGFEWYMPPKSLTSSKNVILTGQINSKELLQAFDAATLFINSSNYENFGVAVYEAASAGLPLCLPNQGTFDVFENSALFHHHKNANALAKNVFKIVNNDSLRKELGKTAKNAASNFDYDIVKKKFREFYESEFG